MKTATRKKTAKLPVNSTGPKDFDSVKTMRTIRDRISKEIMDMTFEEENAYLQKLLAKKTA